MVNLKVPTPAPPIRTAREAKEGNPSMPHDAAADEKLKMPHERDESVDMTTANPDPVIEQAAADVERGLRDTSKGEELNSAYKKLK